MNVTKISAFLFIKQMLESVHGDVDMWDYKYY
jgi:hypothetical protein